MLITLCDIVQSKLEETKQNLQNRIQSVARHLYKMSATTINKILLESNLISNLLFIYYLYYI